MRTINTAFLTIIVLLSVGTNSVFAEDIKIGAVDTARVFEQSPQAISAEALIKKEFSSRERELVAQQNNTKAMEERLAKDGAVISEAERKNLERDIINARRELKRNQDEFREDINFRLNEERTKIQKEVFEAIRVVGKENGYDLVLFDGVAYASSKADFSDLVITYLKSKQE